MKRVCKNSTVDGFTIVELLIVILVIAILAAITLIAFNNVTGWAKASAAASAAQQAFKKVATYAVDNADLPPATLAAAGITDQNGTTYQYRTYNSGKNYCITATANSISSYIDNDTHQTPTPGACDGHGVNGVAAVTNLVSYPSFGSATIPAACYQNSGNGSSALTRITSGGLFGPSAARMTWSVAATAEVALVCKVNVQEGKIYSARISARPSWSGAQMRIQFAWVAGSTIYIAGTSSAAQQGVWSTRTLENKVAPAGATVLAIQASFITGARPGVNDTLDADGLMLVEGPTVPNYADGDSPGWIWNGTANNSTSTGPLL